MQIIKHGTKYRTAIWPRCSCEFGFIKSEIKVHGDMMFTETIRCPECGKDVHVTYSTKENKE